jgi:hypothetical protein
MNDIKEKLGCFGEDIIETNATTSKKFWVQIPTRKFYVAPKPNTREERGQGIICSFRRGN